jgi:hypothetical protein
MMTYRHTAHADPYDSSERVHGPSNTNRRKDREERRTGQKKNNKTNILKNENDRFASPNKTTMQRS